MMLESSALSLSGLPGIPWKHIQFGLGELWQWNTPHFVATIISDGQMYQWTLSLPAPNTTPDTPSSSPAASGNSTRREQIQQYLRHVQEKQRLGDAFATNMGETFAEGKDSRFNDAERHIRETVGKSFHPTLGYVPYAGNLAYTFTIGTGQRINFEPYLSMFTTVEVSDDHGNLTTYHGILDTDHYYITVKNGDQEYTIRPSYIMRVYNTAHPTPTEYNPTRIYPGRVTPGCTGSAGHQVNTVTHAGLPCPIHERT